MKNIEVIKEEIIASLKTIFDPELPVNIWDLGLIYGIDITSDYQATITMTLTSPHCPVAESLPITIKSKLEQIEELKSVNIKITFNPPWSMDKLSEEAKLELGFL
jgi:FeS assembly SUF system protein